MEFVSGFVAIIGSPNVGKSTLMNALIGQKIAIISNKAQTTRNRITGILTEKNFQIIFLDTPGMHAPHNKLGEYMVKTAYAAAADVDLTLMLIDAFHGVGERDEEIISQLNGEYFLVAINKIDTVPREIAAVLTEKLIKLGVQRENICLISAKEKTGLDELKRKIISFLEPGPMFYPADMITDRPERFVAAEIIREKALNNLRDELPHGIGVEIERLEEGETLTKVAAVIYCERASHKGMIIGKGGTMLKKIGSDARTDLQMLFGTKVFLELWIKVKNDWRNSGYMLKELGYREE